MEQLDIKSLYEEELKEKMISLGEKPFTTASFAALQSRYGFSNIPSANNSVIVLVTARSSASSVSTRSSARNLVSCI